MRSVLFDIDGVLVHGWHDNPAKRRRWDTMLKEDMGIDPNDIQPFFAEDSWLEVLLGHRPLEDALASYLLQIGYRGSARNVIDYWMPRDGRINNSLWSIVEKLRATGKVKLYIATNQEHVRAAYLWNEFGFKNIFDDMFYAAEFGAMKPDAAFFAACDERMGFDKTGTPLFFDDTPSYIEGARAAGWEAILYEDEQSCLSHPFIKKLLGSV